MNGFSIFLRKELRESVATNRLLAVVLVLGLFGLLTPILAYYTPDLLRSLGNGIQITVPPPQLRDVVDQFLKNVAGNGIFVVILNAMGSVAREKELGTAAFILTKPLSRAAFLMAKFGVLSLTLAAGLAVAALGTFLYTLPLFHATLDGGFWIAALLVFMVLLAYAALTFLGSVLATSTVVAAGYGIAAFASLAIIGAFPAFASYTPNGLLECARALAIGQAPPHFVLSLLATAAWIVMPIAAALVIFPRQELAGSAAS